MVGGREGWDGGQRISKGSVLTMLKYVPATLTFNLRMCIFVYNSLPEIQQVLLQLCISTNHKTDLKDLKKVMSKLFRDWLKWLLVVV